MNFKKALLTTLTTIMVGGVVLSANQNTSQFEPQATSPVETHRIWVTVNNSTWGSAGNTYLYVFGGPTGDEIYQNWPGILLITGGNSTSNNYETGNSKWFYDVPTQYTKFFFTRRNPSNINEEWDRTKDNDILNSDTSGFYFDLDYSESPDKRTVESFTAVNTARVQNLINTMDGEKESCSEADATTAINTYNAMPTFDQNQFDVHVFSGTSTTGLQRLQYLRSFNNIATPLD